MTDSDSHLIRVWDGRAGTITRVSGTGVARSTAATAARNIGRQSQLSIRRRSRCVRDRVCGGYVQPPHPGSTAASAKDNMMLKKKQAYTVAVLGATRAVGKKVSRFWKNAIFRSRRCSSFVKAVSGEVLTCQGKGSTRWKNLTEGVILCRRRHDVVFISATDAISREYKGARLGAAGVVVIDDSAVFGWIQMSRSWCRVRQCCSVAVHDARDCKLFELYGDAAAGDGAETRFAMWRGSNASSSPPFRRCPALWISRHG